jgi:hypothetical protein
MLVLKQLFTFLKGAVPLHVPNCRNDIEAEAVMKSDNFMLCMMCCAWCDVHAVLCMLCCAVHVCAVHVCAVHVCAVHVCAVHDVLCMYVLCMYVLCMQFCAVHVHDMH